MKDNETASGGETTAAGSVERRQGKRHNTVLRVAVLATDAGNRRFCLMRNISDGGVMIEVDHAVVGQRATIDLQAQSVGGRVVWVRERLAGVAFDSKTQWAGLLKVQPQSRKWRPRKPRIATDRLADARVGWARHFVAVTDISLGGLRIEGDVEATPGTGLVISLDGLGSVHGCVRWRKDGACGVSFNQPLPLAAVNAWLLQQHSAVAR